MARHERQPNKADSQASNVRKPRTFSSTATVGTSKSNNSVNATNRDEKLRTKAPGTSYRTAPEDPFQMAILQGVQDGDTWVHNHVKNLIRRSIIVAVIVVAVCIVVFGVMGVRTSQKMRELNAINDCRDAVAAMNASYSKDFQLKGKIVDAFPAWIPHMIWKSSAPCIRKKSNRRRRLTVKPTRPGPPAKPTPNEPHMTNRPEPSSGR